MLAEERKRVYKKSQISGALFYIVLVAVLVGVFFLTREEEAGIPRHIAGFSVMRVLTGSMQSEIPQHSLIITRQVDPREIRVGDDITFLVSETRTMTHRVILIYEEYRDTGQRGFQTQGIENPSPDWEIVRPENIVGRVVWSSLPLGQASRFLMENILFVGIFAVLFIAFLTTMSIAFKSKNDKEEVEGQLKKRALEDKQIGSILNDIYLILED